MVLWVEQPNLSPSWKSTLLLRMSYRVFVLSLAICSRPLTCLLYTSLKIAEVEKSVTSVEKGMSTKIEDSITNIKEQIKNEVEQCLNQNNGYPEKGKVTVTTCLLYTSQLNISCI